MKPGQQQIGGPAFGIAQWEGRQDDLRAFAAQQGKPVDDLGTHLDFLWQELQTTESASLAALKGAGSARDAAVIFEEKFERAGIPTWRDGSVLLKRPSAPCLMRPEYRSAIAFISASKISDTQREVADEHGRIHSIQ